MSILQSTFLSLFLFASVFPAVAQDTASATQAASTQPTAAADIPQEAPSAQLSQPAAVSMNDVIDRVVQREHFFLAQMRHPDALEGMASFAEKRPPSWRPER